MHREVYEFISEYWGLSMEEIMEMSYNDFMQLLEHTREIIKRESMPHRHDTLSPRKKIMIHDILTVK